MFLECLSLMYCAYDGFNVVVVKFVGFRPYSYDGSSSNTSSSSGNVVQRASVSREHVLKPTKGKYSERGTSDPKKKESKRSNKTISRGKFVSSKR